MTSERGGWTLVSTKVHPSTYSVIGSRFSKAAAAVFDKDTTSRIHMQMKTWEEVMFRFSDVTNIRVIYNRKAGSRSGVKHNFDNFLMNGGSYQQSVSGFYKYSPADGGQRNPSSGFASITSFMFGEYGISENPDGSDKWLNLWYKGDNSYSYFASDNSQALGTKCIAGYCYLDKPVWIMVR